MSAGAGADRALSVSEFVELLNQTYEYVFPSVSLVGELANFRVSKNKWVYFDLKDEASSVKCFGTVQLLREVGPIEDGMMLQVRGAPRMHNLYGFSFNLQLLRPVGEGSIRRAAELLARQLQAEGLFDESRKRPIPYPPSHIGLITSRQSAAFVDFTKILAARWGGVRIDLVDVQVQGEAAPAQIIAAIERFNELANPPEVLVLIRGGGSADDLGAFSTESVVRAVAASRVPTLAAIGHEIDVSLSELAADKRASTPSNAAELLVPDKRTELDNLKRIVEQMYDAVHDRIADERHVLADFVESSAEVVTKLLEHQRAHVMQARDLLEVLSPQAALKRGYAVVRKPGGQLVRSGNDVSIGAIVHIAVDDDAITASVTDIRHGKN